MVTILRNKSRMFVAALLSLLLFSICIQPAYSDEARQRG